MPVVLPVPLDGKFPRLGRESGGLSRRPHRLQHPTLQLNPSPDERHGILTDVSPVSIVSCLRNPFTRTDFTWTSSPPPAPRPQCFRTILSLSRLTSCRRRRVRGGTSHRGSPRGEALCGWTTPICSC